MLWVSRTPGGHKLFVENREIPDDFPEMEFGRLNSLKREITRESTLKNIEESSITQSNNSKIRTHPQQTGSVYQSIKPRIFTIFL